VNPGTIVRGLLEGGVRFVVIGGVAASVHGSARVTFDVDICYDPAPENLERLAQVLKSWDAYLRGAEPGLPWVLDARSVRINPVLTLVTRLGNVDVMDRIDGVGDYRKVLASSAEVDYDGARFRVLSLDALIAAKRATGRRKDREALLELEALREKIRGRSKK
jgi:predicted nucleotidyltransferase